MRIGLLLPVLLTAALSASAASNPSAQRPATTNNDDSCDIGVSPAATLLLPYFEVDLGKPVGQSRTTVFNIINVTSLPQIARVTLWSDWAYPTLSFSVFLTGYDVQAIDMRDVLVRGSVPTRVDPPGRFSDSYQSNPNHLRTMINDCSARMPYIPASLLNDVVSVLTTGLSTGRGLSCPLPSGEEARLGTNHGSKIAAGYATVDVVATCSPIMPTQAEYYNSLLLYDNVLTGDAIFIDPNGSGNGYATGSPLVHIRAVPEGGAAGSRVATRLPYTFYDRFTSETSASRSVDRRQPLPSTFAARWIEGGIADFQTRLTFWRETATGPRPACAQYETNSTMPFAEVVRFDERENAVVSATQGAAAFTPRAIAAAARIDSFSPFLPASRSTDLGGWFFMNLDNGGSQAYSESTRHNQNWVEVTLFAEGRYGVQYPAAAMGNGCSNPPAVASPISPAKNVNQ